MLFKKLFLLSLLILSLSACSTIRKVKVVFPASFVDMVRISDHVYVNQSMLLEQRKTLLNNIPKAKKRVAEIWGNVLSTPIIYACSTQSCFKNLGGGARAHQIFNYIVLSPLALNAEIISHEWSHTELRERVGDTSEIPSWFNEGLAVIVSHEARHDESAWKKVISRKLPFPKMHELKSLSDWNQAVGKYQRNIDANELIVVYAAAGHVVNQWYKNNGVQGLGALMNGINKGQAFAPLYQQ